MKRNPGEVQPHESLSRQAGRFVARRMLEKFTPKERVLDVEMREPLEVAADAVEIGDRKTAAKLLAEEIDANIGGLARVNWLGGRAPAFISERHEHVWTDATIFLVAYPENTAQEPGELWWFTDEREPDSTQRFREYMRREWGAVGIQQAKALLQLGELTIRDDVGETGDQLLVLTINNTLRDRAKRRKYLKDNEAGEFAIGYWMEILRRDTDRLLKESPRNNPAKPKKPQRIVAKLSRDMTPFPGPFTVTSPGDLFRQAGKYLDFANEVFFVLFVDVRNNAIGYTEFTAGAVASVLVHPSGIFQAALLCGAAAFITIHNHPSGNPEPSPEDRELWTRLRDAGALMGIPLLDNLVFGNGRYFSEMEDAQ